MPNPLTIILVVVLVGFPFYRTFGPPAKRFKEQQQTDSTPVPENQQK